MAGKVENTPFPWALSRTQAAGEGDDTGFHSGIGQGTQYLPLSPQKGLVLQSKFGEEEGRPPARFTPQVPLLGHRPQQHSGYIRLPLGRPGGGTEHGGGGPRAALGTVPAWTQTPPDHMRADPWITIRPTHILT